MMTTLRLCVNKGRFIPFGSLRSNKFASPYLAAAFVSSFPERNVNELYKTASERYYPHPGVIRATTHLHTPVRKIFIASALQDATKGEGTEEDAINDDADGEPNEAQDEDSPKTGKGNKREPEKPVERHLNRDRTKVIPVETSMRYLKSSAYKETYGDNPVWALYRRNFPGQFTPKHTRKTCIRQGKISTGNPCPICRDELLVIDYTNVDLLKQFISPYNGEVLGYYKTGVCRIQHRNLLVAIEKAKDYGTITFDIPFREYDYSEYEKIYASY